MVLETNDLIIIGSAVMFPNIGAILGGSILEAFCRIDPWIQSLIKPAYSPPTWVLPPLWIVIFCSIGLASYLVYKEATLSAERWDWGVQLPLMLYMCFLFGCGHRSPSHFIHLKWWVCFGFAIAYTTSSVNSSGHLLSFHVTPNTIYKLCAHNF